MHPRTGLRDRVQIGNHDMRLLSSPYEGAVSMMPGVAEQGAAVSLVLHDNTESRTTAIGATARMVSRPEEATTAIISW